MNFCRECHGLGKTLSKQNSKEICQVCRGGVPLRSDIESSLLEKGGDEVLVEFPENARAMVLKGYKISLDLFSSACPELLLFYKHPLNFQN